MKAISKVISGVIVGGILGLCAGLLLGGVELLIGTGALLGGIAMLPVPGVVKGTVAGAAVGLLVHGLVTVLLLPHRPLGGAPSFLLEFMVGDMSPWVFVLLGMVFCGMVGRNMDADSEENERE